MSTEMNPTLGDVVILALSEVLAGAKPHPVERKMTVDLPVYDMRIGMTYKDGRRKGIIKEVIPLGRRDRTQVEVVVKFPSSRSHPEENVKHYRHEIIGTFETEI